MKIQMKLHLLYIVAIVLLASCENEIPYNPDNQQPIIRKSKCSRVSK